MVKHNGKFELPANPTLKDINLYKKHLNWGELPPFYHLVAASVSEAEGTFSYGFDNAIKQLTDKRNWNLELLEGRTNQYGEIECTSLPRIALNQVFSERGFELLAFPYAKDKPIDQYVKDNKAMEYKLWDPHMMRSIVRINQLHKFIQFYFHSGDAADKALILHSHKVVYKTIEYLKSKLNICQITGVSVKEFYKYTEASESTGEVELALAHLTTNDLLLKKD